ncbi:MAG: bifunctional 3'-5' exonuclease/DNA polymerase [Homoserinimonas sp.]
MHVALASDSDGSITITPIGGPGEKQSVTRAALPAVVAILEAQHPRWVWDDTSRWYPPLLTAGVRVERCVDLRLCRAILRNSELTSGSVLARSEPDDWDRPAAVDRPSDGLFVLDDQSTPDPVAEFARQQDAAVPGIGLLLAAESAGSLIAAEMRHAGLPWRADLHDALLTRTLGSRPAQGARPAIMESVLGDIRRELAAPNLNPDSPVELLKVLRNAGIMVASTGKWELEKVTHPAIRPLLEYKKLARLLSANGWQWLEANIQDGRFRPEYVVGGVVTGRWASTGGGGALQLPKQVRGAVVADPGWKLVVADAAQLEPRILAGMAGDRGMVEAGTAGDLYAGIVARGAVKTRDEAKVAMLGAMYGATTGESGRLMPALTRAFPRAIGLVEQAARAGERGEKVSTRLGRSSPLPSDEWRDLQSSASADGSTEATRSRARSEARSWGRFTRNFVVQGTAAEWALCWMASLRRNLHELSEGSWITRSAHLVFFMHDEVVIHFPEEQADAVAEAVRAAAAEAGRLLFGEMPVGFPLTVAIVDSYAEAK